MYKLTENKCSNCKHLGVIISQTSDYYCYYNHQNMSLLDFVSNCDGFELDVVSLSEKEDRVWG